VDARQHLIFLISFPSLILWPSEKKKASARTRPEASKEKEKRKKRKRNGLEVLMHPKIRRCESNERIKDERIEE
jgi:hypothetical protein